MKGDARNAVESLMMTTNSAKDIMKALERRYGNEDDVILKLVGAIRDLPKLNSGKTDIVAFASVVKNNVLAMLSVGHDGYIHNIELVRDLLSKLPHAMIYRYNEFIAFSSISSNLKSLGDFLDREADMASRAGTTRILSNASKDFEKRGDKRNFTKRIHAISNESNTEIAEGSGCWYCQKKGHHISNCKSFSDLPLPNRWRWAKQERCYKCLGPKHMSRSCNAPQCGINGCKIPHHYLLHSYNNSRAPVNNSGVNAARRKESSS